MDDLDRQIEEAKARLKKTQQLAELNQLQAQAQAVSSAGRPSQSNQTDPMFKMLKWAFPIGIVFLGVGLVVFMLFHNWTIGLTFDGLGAVCIGVKVALTPSIRIPIIDDRKRSIEGSNNAKHKI